MIGRGPENGQEHQRRHNDARQALGKELEPNPALGDSSSAEEEVVALGKLAMEALGLRTMCREWGLIAAENPSYARFC